MKLHGGTGRVGRAVAAILGLAVLHSAAFTSPAAGQPADPGLRADAATELPVLELTVEPAGGEMSAGPGSIELVPVESLVAVEGDAEAGACGNVATVSRDIFNAFAKELAAFGCAVSGAGLVMISACYKSGDKMKKATGGMIKKWNEMVAHGTWATIGPRRWEVEPAGDAISHNGTIQSWGTRIFVHQQPVVSEKVRVSIRKVSGQNPVEVTVCKWNMAGTPFKIWDFRIDASAPDGKLYTKDFSSLEGWVLSAQLAGKNATRKLEYRIRGTRL